MHKEQKKLEQLKAKVDMLQEELKDRSEVLGKALKEIEVLTHEKDDLLNWRQVYEDGHGLQVRILTLRESAPPPPPPPPRPLRVVRHAHAPHFVPSPLPAGAGAEEAQPARGRAALWRGAGPNEHPAERGAKHHRPPRRSLRKAQEGGGQAERLQVRGPGAGAGNDGRQRAAAGAVERGGEPNRGFGAGKYARPRRDDEHGGVDRRARLPLLRDGRGHAREGQCVRQEPQGRRG